MTVEKIENVERVSEKERDGVRKEVREGKDLLAVRDRRLFKTAAAASGGF